MGIQLSYGGSPSEIMLRIIGAAAVSQGKYGRHKMVKQLSYDGHTMVK